MNYIEFLFILYVALANTYYIFKTKWQVNFDPQTAVWGSLYF